MVLEVGCPKFVPLIEAGHSNTEEIRQAAVQYLTPLLAERVEAIVLGCTHYPLIEPLLKQLLPKEVRLVDPAIGLAQNLGSFLELPLESAKPSLSLGNTQICVTSDPEGFAQRASKWLGLQPEVDLVSLRTKACFF